MLGRIKKHIIILALLLGFVIIGFAQQGRLDSALNNYERKYREELNESDSMLIALQISSLKNDCEELDSLFKSNEYSGAYKSELARQAFVNEFCLAQIVEHLALFFPSQKSLRPYEVENFPLVKLFLCDTIMMEEFADKISKEKMLCSSKLLDDKTSLGYFHVDQFLKWYAENRKDNLHPCEMEKITLFKH